ncbi:MAG TPA: hydroxymethylpyrimidine/phosphomethylpyrimidine kinase [Burkholderiaceae bacterium]|jgi:hydroxymethylpyrimidine/phosphomethylpyrimidine kinase|nr:hydroxymethylpyrimidine/phosphomethylpyrimidine kinase [Burkholderiaceae bacterium]
MTRPSVLVFAGADPSGGAGIQADIQAIAALGAHPLSVITALTVQDNDHVFAVHPVSASLVQQQAQALLKKIDIAAVKIGIVANRANAEAIAGIVRELRQYQPDLPVVFDPVLASGHGDALAVEDAVQAVAPLITIATLITPNLPEASALCEGERRSGVQAEILLRRGCGHVLIKGGHGSANSNVVNQWFTEGDFRSWSWPRLAGSFHGSGCTLAAAVAALLAGGKPMEQAIDLAQTYCQKALESSYAIAAGQRIPDRIVSFFRESA